MCVSQLSSTLNVLSVPKYVEIMKRYFGGDVLMCCGVDVLSFCVVVWHVGLGSSSQFEVLGRIELTIQALAIDS